MSFKISKCMRTNRIYFQKYSNEKKNIFQHHQYQILVLAMVVADNCIYL